MSAAVVLSGSPPRSLVVHLPCFRLERCGWSASDEVVLIAEEKNALRLQAISPPLQKLGLKPGMTVSAARALFPELEVELLEDPFEELRDLAALAELFRELSPSVRVLPPDAIALDITDTVQLMGGERRCLRRALELAAETGHSASVVVADSAEGALALCAWKGSRLVPQGKLAEELADVPLAWLPGMPETMRDSLETLGVRYAGELARLPSSSVAARYGSEGLRMLLVARGQVVSPPIPPVVDPGLPSCGQVLLEPVVGVEALLHVLGELLVQLCDQLRTGDQAATRLGIELVLEGAPERVVQLRLGRPRRDPDELAALLEKRLEGLTLEGPLMEVGLRAIEACSWLGVQPGLLDRGQGHEQLPDLVARLMDALGAEAVMRPGLRDQHRPEARWGAEPVEQRAKPVVVEGPPRPAVLLAAPLPVEVLDGPGGLEALEVEARTLPIRSATGPERLCGAWWEPMPFSRDYWRLELADGRCAWVFRELEGEDWWLHGWSD